jgi:hypothetical protein
LTLTIALTSPSRVEAFGGPPGGPFGNGSYFPNEGTFSAVVRGENLAGTLQFSTTSDAGPVNSTTANGSTSSSGTGGVGSTGVATIFFEGFSYSGNSQGSYNPEGSSMMINFEAESQGQGSQTYTLSRQVVSTANATVQSVGNGTLTSAVTLTTSSGVYYDSRYFSGFAECKTSNAFPNQKFQGKGEATSRILDFKTNVPNVLFLDVPITMTGVRLSNTASAFATRNVRRPSVSRNTIVIP